MDRLLRYSLSDKDISIFLKKYNVKHKILLYDELNYIDIKDFIKDMENNVSYIILYRSSNNYGHWVCINKVNNIICFFDSYGIFPDDEKKYINEDFLFNSNQLYNRLSELLYESKYDIHYNEVKLQKKCRNISTCGRHVICFLLSNKNIEDYQRYILDYCKIKKITPDVFVSVITKNIK